MTFPSIGYLVNRIEAAIWCSDLEMRLPQVILFGLLQRAPNISCVSLVVKTGIRLSTVLPGNALVFRKMVALH